MGITMTCCSAPEEKQQDKANQTATCERTPTTVYTYPALTQYNLPRSLSITTLRPVQANWSKQYIITQ